MQYLPGQNHFWNDKHLFDPITRLFPSNVGKNSTWSIECNLTTSVITVFVNTNICQDAYVFYLLLVLQWNADIVDVQIFFNCWRLCRWIQTISKFNIKNNLYYLHACIFFCFLQDIALIYKNSNRNNLYIGSMTVTLNERSLYLVI